LLAHDASQFAFRAAVERKIGGEHDLAEPLNRLDQRGVALGRLKRILFGSARSRIGRRSEDRLLGRTYGVLVAKLNV
jgi:hypothetical protein